MLELIGLKISGERLNAGGAIGQVWTSTGLGQVVQELQELQRYVAEANQQRGDADKLGALVVVGAGNGRFRGDLLEREDSVNRPEADQIGLMGTVLNAMVLAQKLREAGVPHELVLADGITLALPEMPELRPANPEVIADCVRRGVICLVAGGSAKLRQTTDAAIIDHLSRFHDALDAKVTALKLTKFEGVYDADPAKDLSARLLSRVSANEMLEKHWFAVDEVCLKLVQATGTPVRVYGGQTSLADALNGTVGTLVVADSIEREYA